MARTKDQDKEKAIIEAAIAVFAERGFWNTPTALISKTAGVADGTLFTYFKTKDDLINEVYLELKREMAGEIIGGLAAYSAIRDKMRFIWDRYIDWALAHPDRFKVLHQIEESFQLSESAAAQGMDMFAEVHQMAAESVARGEIRDYPPEYLGALIDSQSAMTIRFITLNGEALDYKTMGFDILWNGVTR